MERPRFGATLAILAGLPFACFASTPATPSGTSQGWKVDSQKGGVTIYSRPRPGSKLKEFKAVGEIAAPTRAVQNVLIDVEAYTSFMPFTTECRVVKREEDSLLAYQRLSPKLVSDRDYTIRIREKSWPEKDGLVYLHRWEPANEFGPPEKKGVLRVKLCEGSWLLEPQGANKTRATYSIYTDSGGALPAFIANTASEIAIRKVFAAVRKQVKQSKYHAREHHRTPENLYVSVQAP